MASNQFYHELCRLRSLKILAIRKYQLEDTRYITLLDHVLSLTLFQQKCGL